MAMRLIIAISILVFVVVSIASAPVLSAGLSGDVRVGYLFLDEEGHMGVNQPTYNLYDGPVVSFERFAYRFENGARLSGSIKNITFNNRNLSVGVAKSGQYGLTVRHNKYRRTFSIEGDQFTRRHKTTGQGWVQPHDNIRLFGGYGQIQKNGQMAELFDPVAPAVKSVDFKQKFFNAGIRLHQQRRFVELEYRGSDFTDETDATNERNSKRFKVTASAPVPNYEDLVLNAGFIRYQTEVGEQADTMTTSVTWGSAGYNFGDGLSARYSALIDRSRRTDDLVATDNISHALLGSKLWRGQGGITAGYRFASTDDVQAEISTVGFLLSGWVRASPKITLKAGYGSESKEVQDGRTLTGDANYTRFRASARMRFDEASFAVVKLENRKTENDNIGSVAEYLRLSGDVRYAKEEYGEAQVSYAYFDGNYENDGGQFQFQDHVFNGDLWTRDYKDFKAWLGGTYVRSKEDVDIESFSVRLSGIYSFRKDHRLEVVYTAHNFDDLSDITPPYTQYYTANVVEVSVVRAF
jgi:hypothetical protein